jgi:hypothetical protein
MKVPHPFNETCMGPGWLPRLCESGLVFLNGLYQAPDVDYQVTEEGLSKYYTFPAWEAAQAALVARSAEFRARVATLPDDVRSVTATMTSGLPTEIPFNLAVVTLGHQCIWNAATQTWTKHPL